MESTKFFDVSKRPRYRFKKHPFVSLVDHSLGIFSQILSNALHVQDVISYIHYKFERNGDNEIQQDLNEVLDGHLNLKS